MRRQGFACLRGGRRTGKRGFRNRAAAPQGLGQTYRRRPESFYKRVNKQLGVRAKLICCSSRARCLAGSNSWSMLGVAAASVEAWPGLPAHEAKAHPGTEHNEREPGSGSIPGRLGSSSEPGTFPGLARLLFFFFSLFISFK
jgi:hypothetical protein